MVSNWHPDAWQGPDFPLADCSQHTQRVCSGLVPCAWFQHYVLVPRQYPTLLQVLYGASPAWSEADAWANEDSAATAPGLGAPQRSELEALAGQVLEELLRDSLWNAPTHLPPAQLLNDADARHLTPQVIPLTLQLCITKLCEHARAVF